MTLACVLFDLDGVIRHFDPLFATQIEDRYALEPGSLANAAFEKSRLERLVTGRLLRADWKIEVGDAVGNREAPEAWFANIGVVDPSIIELIAELRSAGFAIAMLTNGTDTIPQELATLGIDHHFDRVFSTFNIGFMKPDTRAFSYVCEHMNLSPSQVFFTDDRSENVAAAKSLGMSGTTFTDTVALREELHKFGLLI
jgi:glucose-1-phosphatase